MNPEYYIEINNKKGTEIDIQHFKEQLLINMRKGNVEINYLDLNIKIKNNSETELDIYKK